ncbi:helix-turn-helix transcriptional regulator [Bradyrhizobium centrolobii]|uniref:helix-turn-helix transcriptional regulator n=1 Tax=Bradyrhizobium centrolobii TaxID=1505087 RepID=UPI000AA8E787|nr:helix-turn-helix transcriptional regulator [Bradyrhizobium centrolobii]
MNVYTLWMVLAHSAHRKKHGRGFDMLNLSQSATLPRTIALQHQSTESIFNISNRVLPVQSEATNCQKHDGLRGVLARIGCGQVLLRRGRLVELSPTGRAILERESEASASHDTLYGAVKQLVNRAGAQFPAGSTSWLATSTKEGFTALVNQVANAWTDETIALILLDLDAHPEPSPRTLQRLFGFTAAETQLALELARGHNLLDIARARRLSRTTVRSQLASLFVKTQTRRQADLIALLGRVAILP